MATKKKAAGAKSAAERIQQYEAALEEGRAGYKRADEILEGLMGSLMLNDPIAMPDGTLRQLVDNFAEKNVVFKPCGVRRYEIKEVKAPKAPKAAA